MTLFYLSALGFANQHIQRRDETDDAMLESSQKYGS